MKCHHRIPNPCPRDQIMTQTRGKLPHHSSDTIIGKPAGIYAISIGCSLPVFIVFAVIYMFAYTPSSIADPNNSPGPYAPTIHPHLSSTRLHRSSSHSSSATKHSSAISHSSTRTSSSHISTSSPARSSSHSVQSSSHSVQSSSSISSHHMTSTSSTNTGISRTSTANTGIPMDVAGGRDFFTQFDPCDLTVNDFIGAGLPPLTPRDISNFTEFQNHRDSRMEYGRVTIDQNYGGIAQTLDYCRYANSNNINSNLSIEVQKHTYRGTNLPLSISDEENEHRDFLDLVWCHSTIRYEPIVVNGWQAVKGEKYDRFGNLNGYYIYVLGVLFDIGITNNSVCPSWFWNRHINPSEYDKLLALVERKIPQAPRR